VIQVNLWGVIHGVQAFVPRMLKMGEGEERHIVNTASISGLMALPMVGVYATTKYAVVGLSESLRADLARHAVGVSVLCPGGVQTGILAAHRNRPESLGGGQGRAKGTVRSVAGNAQADSEDMMDPAEVAQAMVEGVRANDAFILTHPRYGEFLEARHRELMAAVEKARARRSG
jgi:short-subunit dehydrogenase